MKYYHATTLDSAEGILKDKVIKTSYEGVVYLADSYENAYKFIALRAFGEPIVVFECDNLDEDKIEESFDHNSKFFKCDAWMYFDNIPLSNVTDMQTFTMRKS